MRTLALALPLLLLFSPPALGCRAAEVPVESAAASATSIYRGVVSGVHLPAFETDLPRLHQGQTAAETYRVSPRIVRVVVVETTKGTPVPVIEFDLNWCGGGYAEVGDYVTVYHRPEREMNWILHRDADNGR